MIRKATKTDIDAIEQSYTELLEYEEKNGSNSNWVKDLYPTRIIAEESEKAGTLYVLEDKGEICASVILNHYQPDGYEKMNWSIEADGTEVLVVHTLCIPPSKAGNGYGKKIVEFAEETARKMNCKTIRLDTYAGNVPAASLYEKMGYRLVGEDDFLLQGLIPERLKIFEYLIK